MTQDELNVILEKHRKWLKLEEGGERANLSEADLRNADLRDVNLSSANLFLADLKYADLSNANLGYVDLRNANLEFANLSNSDLRYAMLFNTNLQHANLSNSDLRFANLEFADLRYAKNVPFVPYVCPDFGSFIGYKKASGYIIELEILADAKRCSATSRKCRCDKAKVLSIQNLDGSLADVKEVASNYDITFIYEVGEIVAVADFDENRWNECSTGIHFFINRQEAVDYIG